MKYIITDKQIQDLAECGGYSARMIASWLKPIEPLYEAAPDLLEAVWVCMEHNRLYFGDAHNTVIQARAAIAKATGDAP